MSFCRCQVRLRSAEACYGLAVRAPHFVVRVGPDRGEGVVLGVAEHTGQSMTRAEHLVRVRVRAKLGFEGAWGYS